MELTSQTPTTSTETETDDIISKSLKTLLSTDGADWGDVKDRWEKTFILRQNELKNTKSNVEFFKAWPKYKDARASDLVSIKQYVFICNYS